MCQLWLGNNISDEGAKMLSEGLKENTTLTSLNLKGKKKEKETKKKLIVLIDA